MIVPYYVGIFSPPDGCHGNQLTLTAATTTTTTAAVDGVTKVSPALGTGVQVVGDTLTYVNSGVTTVTAPVSPAASMELVWHGEYERLFRQYYPHTWYLVPTPYPPNDRWQVFKDSAKVRFSCGVIGNVYNRVGQCYYGFVRPPLRIDRRQGKPRNQHNAELCQACKEGLCREEWTVAAAPS